MSDANTTSLSVWRPITMLHRTQGGHLHTAAIIHKNWDSPSCLDICAPQHSPRRIPDFPKTPLERKMHDDGQNCQGAKGVRIDGATTPETTGIRSWSVDSKGLRTKSSPLSLRIGLTTRSRCCHFTRAAASCCQPVWRKAGTAVRRTLHATESKRQRGHVPRASVARIFGMFGILDKHIYNALSWKSQMATRPGCCVVEQEHVSHSHPPH